MNRIYKVIWSKVKHCYVVVSEFAKTNSKSSCFKCFSWRFISAVLLGVLNFCSFVKPVFAVDSIEGSGNSYPASHGNFIFAGNGNTIEDGDFAMTSPWQNVVALGDGNFLGEESNRNLIIGSSNSLGEAGYHAGAACNVIVGSSNFISYGQHYAENYGGQLIFGNGNTIVNDLKAALSYHESQNVTIIGGNNKVLDNEGDYCGNVYANISGYYNTIKHAPYSVTLGNFNEISGYQQGILIGDKSVIDSANYSVAIGYKPTLQNSTYGIALGYQSVLKDAPQSVAIGTNSYTTGNYWSVALGTASVAKGETDNVVSVGHKYGDPTGKDNETYSNTLYRRIVNVKDGAEAHDAATVEQLDKVFAGSNVIITSSTASNGARNKTINVVGDGTIVKNDSRIVSGDTVYRAYEDVLRRSEVTAGDNIVITDTFSPSVEKTISEIVSTYSTGPEKTSAVSEALTTYGNVIQSDPVAALGLTNQELSEFLGSLYNESLVGSMTQEKFDEIMGKSMTLAAETFACKQISAKSDGTVAAHDSKLVTGDTVFNEVRVDEDGNYIKAENTTAENLKALDEAVQNGGGTTSDALAVRYDSDTKDIVSLAGTDGTKITNLKEATLSENSTDAVTGSQLYTTNQNLINEATARADEDIALSNRIGTLSVDGNFILKDNSVSQNLAVLDANIKSNADAIQGVKLHYIGVKGGGSSALNYDGAGAVGANSIAIGSDAKANFMNSIAIGSQAFASGSYSYASKGIAIGEEAHTVGGVAIGTWADTDYGVAIGSSAKNLNKGTFNYSGVAIGHATVSGRGSLAVGDAYARAAGEYALAVGSFTYSKGNHAVVLGESSYAMSDDTVALGSLVFVKNNKSVAIGSESSVNPNLTDSVVSFGHVPGDPIRTEETEATPYVNWSNTVTRRIINVTDGKNPSDAATVKQTMRLEDGTNTTVVSDGLNYKGQSLYKVNVVGNGQIRSGNTGLLSGNTVYNETRVYQDGNYIKSANAANLNLMALDSAVRNSLQRDEIVGGENIIVSDNVQPPVVKTIQEIVSDCATGSDKTSALSSALTAYSNVLQGDPIVALGLTGAEFNDFMNSLYNGSLYGSMTQERFDEIMGKSMTIEGERFLSKQISAKSDGAVVANDSKLVTGNTVYNEVRVAQDGNYIKADYTTAENLQALDEAVKNAGTGTGGSTVINNYNGTNWLGIEGEDDDVEGNNFSGENATGTHAIAGGYKASASGSQSIAFGVETNVTGTNSIAVGSGNVVTGDNSGAFGDPSVIDGDNSYSVGNNNTIADGTFDVFVLGNNVTTTANNTVVLGSNSDGSQDNVVSVGSDTEQRRIIHVAAGTSGTDVATVGQTFELVAGDHVVLTDDGTNTIGQTKKVVSVDVNGTIANGDIDIVSGGAVYTEVRPDHDGYYVKTDDTTGTNLLALDTQLKATTDAVGLAVKYNDGSKDKVTLEGTNGTTIANVKNALNDDEAVNLGQLKASIVDYSYKANSDASNVGVHVSDANSTLWGEALGSGVVEQNNHQLVTGVTVHTEVRPDHDGYYVKTDETTGVNLLALDSKVKENSDGIDDLNVLTVKYDTAEKTKVTLQGLGGTTIDNVKDGLLSDTSNEAVNGSQLYAEQQMRIDADLALSNRIGVLNADGNYILKDNNVSENLVVLDDSLKNVESKVNQGFDVLTDGILVKNVNPNDNVLNFKAGANIVLENDNGSVKITSLGSNASNPLAVNYDTLDKDLITLQGTDGTTITNVKAGEVSSDSMDSINGSQLYATNQQVETNRQHIETVEQKIGVTNDGTYVSSTNTVGQNLNALDNAITEANTSINNLDGRVTTTETNITELNENLKRKANVDASNVAQYTSQWGEAIGTGLVEDGNNELVTGNTVFHALKNVDNSNKMNTNMDNITAEGEKVVKEIMRPQMELKANKDASNIEVPQWAEKLGIGQVAEGDTNLVNGDTVFKALENIHAETDLISYNGQTNQIEIGSNDRYAGVNTINVSNANGQGRVITGVLTNPYDATSAVNVGYLNDVTDNLIRGVNDGFVKTDERINRVGANAAALASLEPVPTEWDDKWNLSVALGNYRDETAAAIGAFYKPTSNTMINVKGTVGNSENMIGAGMSIALSKGGNNGPTKIALMNKVNALEKRNDELENMVRSMNEKLTALTMLLDRTKGFPDVPKDHWAIEAVETLHGNDLIQGYPDGEFKGNRSMTRYEYAQMLYNSLKKGVKIKEEHLKEYSKELRMIEANDK